jgi:hypothetical protein
MGHHCPDAEILPDGRLLDLVPEARLTEVHEAWLCPVTRRILDTTLDGLTSRAERSFYIDAWVVRPEGFGNCATTGGDAFSDRVKAIKRRFVQALPPSDGRSSVRIAEGERGI